MSDFLTAGLRLAVARGALANHERSCGVCGEDYDCVVAKQHKRVIADAKSEMAR